jgi:hypothetical protein
VKLVWGGVCVSAFVLLVGLCCDALVDWVVGGWAKAMASSIVWVVHKLMRDKQMSHNTAFSISGIKCRTFSFNDFSTNFRGWIILLLNYLFGSHHFSRVCFAVSLG